MVSDDRTCRQPPGAFKPIVNLGRCEGEGDCIRVCPEDVFELRPYHLDEMDQAFSPALYWRVVGVLAFALALYTATGTALLGSSWLTAYWDALAYWYGGGYCQ